MLAYLKQTYFFRILHMFNYKKSNTKKGGCIKLQPPRKIPLFSLAQTIDKEPLITISKKQSPYFHLVLYNYFLGFTISRQSMSPRSRPWIRTSAVAIFVAIGTL